MFGSMPSGAKAYAKVGLETGVTAASPHRLISMLLEGAIVAVGNAAVLTAARDIPGKGIAISKAIAIIDSGLRTSLDKEAGGAIANSLDLLYQYMSRRLIEANLKSDTAMLDEVEQLLRDLKVSWEQIGAVPAPARELSAASAANVPDYDTLAPRTTSLVKA